MVFQPGGNLYAVAFGARPENVEVPHYDTRAPASTDVLYPIGKEWIYVGQSIWKLLSISSVAGVTTANWVELADSDGAVQSVLGTANQITATNNAGTVTLSTPATFTAPGSITATTTVTATLGNITATNGNVVLSTAGNKLVIATGANASVGTSAAMSGTPGTVTVATTASSATAKIFYSRATTGGTPGQVSITAQDGTGFTLTSTANETSTFNWWIINA